MTLSFAIAMLARCLGGSIVVLMIMSFSVWACEPCPLDYQLDLSGSVAEADLIAVVQRDYDVFEASDRPEKITLDISSLLKGSLATGERITAFSRVGEMCPYGIIIDDDNDHLVLLQKGNGAYNSVHHGCGVGILPLIDGKVEYNKTLIDLKVFATSRGLTMTPVDDDLSWWGRLWQRLFG